jgi:hypothetical protein
MRHWIWTALGWFVAGCIDFGDTDAKIPGEELGAYRVSAELDNSSCGPGALGSTESWQFSVRLSRDGPDLFWLNGAEAICGQVAADGVSFAFETAVRAELQPPQGTQPGCAVLRTDRAAGRLSDPGLDVRSFAAELSYHYAAEAESDCSNLLGSPGGLATLPCEMTYCLQATRSTQPSFAR